MSKDESEDVFCVAGVRYEAVSAPVHGSTCGLCDLAGTALCCVGNASVPDCRRWFRRDGRDVNFRKARDE